MFQSESSWMTGARFFPPLAYCLIKSQKGYSVNKCLLTQNHICMPGPLVGPGIYILTSMNSECGCSKLGASHLDDLDGIGAILRLAVLLRTRGTNDSGLLRLIKGNENKEMQSSLREIDKVIIIDLTRPKLTLVIRINLYCGFISSHSWRGRQCVPDFSCMTGMKLGWKTERK